MLDVINAAILSSEWRLDSIPMWILIALAAACLVAFAVKTVKKRRALAEKKRIAAEREAVLERASNESEKREDTVDGTVEAEEIGEETESSDADRGNCEEIVAAISAAISAILEGEGKDPKGFRVVSFRRSSSRK